MRIWKLVLNKDCLNATKSRQNTAKNFCSPLFKLVFNFYRLGTDSKKIFPRNIMDDHLKKFGHFGLLMAIIVLPIFTDDVDDVNDVEKVAEQFKNLNSNGVDKQNMIKINQRYEQRMLGVCEDMFRLGYI